MQWTARLPDGEPPTMMMKAMCCYGLRSASSTCSCPGTIGSIYLIHKLWSRPDSGGNLSVLKLVQKQLPAVKKNYPRAGIVGGDCGGGLVCRHRGIKYVFGVAHSIKNFDNEGAFKENGLFGLQSLFTNVFQHRAWIEKEMKRDLSCERETTSWGSTSIYIHSK